MKIRKIISLARFHRLVFIIVGVSCFGCSFRVNIRNNKNIRYYKDYDIFNNILLDDVSNRIFIKRPFIKASYDSNDHIDRIDAYYKNPMKKYYLNIKMSGDCIILDRCLARYRGIDFLDSIYVNTKENYFIKYAFTISGSESSSNIYYCSKTNNDTFVIKSLDQHFHFSSNLLLTPTCNKYNFEKSLDSVKINRNPDFIDYDENTITRNLNMRHAGNSPFWWFLIHNYF